MPNASTITINDGTSDLFVLSPDSVTANHVLFQDLTVDQLSLRTLLHFDRPTNGNKQNRCTVRLNVPVERTNGEGETYLAQGTGRAEFIFDSNATPAERLAVRKALAYALLGAEATAVVDNPEWFW